MSNISTYLHRVRDGSEDPWAKVGMKFHVDNCFFFLTPSSSPKLYSIIGISSISWVTAWCYQELILWYFGLLMAGLCSGQYLDDNVWRQWSSNHVPRSGTALLPAVHWHLACLSSHSSWGSTFPQFPQFGSHISSTIGKKNISPSSKKTNVIHPYEHASK